jgi:tRNA pseudouridine32 synthase/23S rRNA pseudouridine746 synthase
MKRGEMLTTTIHQIEDFISADLLPCQEKVTYWYQGICPNTNQIIKLPRTILVEKIAYQLMEYIKEEKAFNDEGKMYGVLLLQDNQGNLKVIKAFSGLFQGKDNLKGWVSQILGRNKFALAEKFTLQELDKIKAKIMELEKLSIRKEYQDLLAKYEKILSNLKQKHRERKKNRDSKRLYYRENLTAIALPEALEKLQQESRHDDWERRNLKKQWLNILQPLEDNINQVKQEISQLKQERKKLSRQLQAQMQGAYSLTNFSGQTLSLSQLINKSFIPTGTGDCCAPKLLHYCAINNFTPLAMAEFWWGKSSPNGEKVAGNFYPACVERCQPLMGFMLSGLGNNCDIKKDYQISIIYEDDYLILVDKPAGFLSVPGRGINKFDSVESRLKHNLQSNHIKAVHRLDQDTSGILVLAKDDFCHRHLCQQFAEKKVDKIYEALLEGVLSQGEGEINLPLWSNPDSRPRQEVNFLRGKASFTRYRVIDCDGYNTRVEFMPLTGRTHQLRVHSAQGLGISIKGDRIYGVINHNDDRLCLHAREINFTHPITNKKLWFKSPSPF